MGLASLVHLVDELRHNTPWERFEPKQAQRRVIPRAMASLVVPAIFAWNATPEKHVRQNPTAQDVDGHAAVLAVFRFVPDGGRGGSAVGGER